MHISGGLEWVMEKMKQDQQFVLAMSDIPKVTLPGNFIHKLNSKFD